MNVVMFGGLGNYGLTLTGLLLERGHRVTILQIPGTVQRITITPQKNYETLIKKFEENGGKFSLQYKNSHLMREYKYTLSVIRSVFDMPTDTEVIVVAYPSLMHESIGRLLKDQIGEKTVITFTDRFLGGYSLLRSAAALNTGHLISVNATPITSFEDRQDPFRRIVYSNKRKIQVACHPPRCQSDLEKLAELIPGDYVSCRDVLELAFNCTPSNLHAPHDLMNLVRYENGHEFSMFHEGFTPGIERLINGVSRERCAIALAFGFEAISFLDYERQTYGYDGDSVTENRRINPELNQIPAPESLWSCKGIEDVACALVPLSELALIAGTPCPIINALISIWGCYLGTDFRKEGRNLSSLGLENKNISEIKRVFAFT